MVSAVRQSMYVQSTPSQLLDLHVHLSVALGELLRRSLGFGCSLAPAGSPLASIAGEHKPCAPRQNQLHPRNDSQVPFVQWGHNKEPVPGFSAPSCRHNARGSGVRAAPGADQWGSQEA